MNLIFNRTFEQRNTPPAFGRPSLRLITLLALLGLYWSLPVHGQVVSPEQQPAAGEEQKQMLGSLSTAGEVYVNESPAVPESTVFSGDRVRTGPTGAATLTVNGRATLKVFPQSQVVLSGNNLFAAELEAGTVVLSTVAGGSGMLLRMGKLVLVPSFPREQSTTSKVERAPDGSSTVACLDGSVGVLTVKDRSGEFLHGGQSLHISSSTLANGEADPVFSSGGTAKSFGPRAPLQGPSPKELALGAGGTAGAAYLIDRLIQGRSRPAVSPSTP